MLSVRSKIALTLVFAVGLAASIPFAAGKKKDKPGTAGPQMDEQKRAVHALSRLTFGPRPGEVQRVMAIGVDKWIEQQLHTEKINDSALDARLAPLRTLRMNTREIVENFPPPERIRAVMNGREPLPSDPVKRAVYQAQMERLEEKRERKQEAGSGPANTPGTNGNPGTSADPASTAAGDGKPKVSDEEAARRRENRFYADLKAEELLDMPPGQRIKEIIKMPPEEQRALANSVKGGKARDLLEGMSPQQKETLMALNNPQQVVASELMQNKLLRAIYSERQLDEVMTDFWFNHFNVFIGKGPDRYFLTSYERDVIRPHVLGKFQDLLEATAKSPAMLVYLDNWLSVGPGSDLARGIPKNPYRPRRRFGANYPRPAGAPKGKGKRSSGLNENYGRELMELHTLGVNGGYTQKDVTEVARVFTGWTVDRPQDGGGFKFEERMHEPGDKLVLGHRIKNHGQKEGEEVLRLLAHHPSTARFISTKLAMRFVSDNPPPSLVNRMAETFLKKDGDIREVLRTMFRAPEFWAPETYRAKVKTPLEFVVSSLRAADADVSNALPLVQQLNTMGMPLYMMQPPTGYSMKAETWVNSSALLGRMNFALALAGDKLTGIQVDTDHIAGSTSPLNDPQQVLALLENSWLGGDVSKQTHDTISMQLDQPQVSQRRLDDGARPPNVGVIAGLILGSPEFQRR
jgi:uncharacterized protein (DUF1800 family)